MTDRDTFAAAALTGLLVHANDSIDEETLDTPSDIAYTAYQMADAMLRERDRTNHTPVAEPMAKEKRAEGSVAEPVAWAVFFDNGSTASVYVGRKPPHAEPLYRHPPCQDFSQKNLTLTDCERGAIERAVDSIASTMPYESQQGLADWKTLRGLLERLR